MAEKFHFFWSGPFSQWYPSNFTVDKRRYNCAEQFMMAQKALAFGDHLTFHDIMISDSPKRQKELGRKVKNFDPNLWTSLSKHIVLIGNRNKFFQNPPLLQLLLDTTGTMLVEASPYDRIWGIGLADDDPRALNRDTWLGKNQLGEILTKLRDDILQGKI